MKPWECPRCRKVNAPWLNQCFCVPPAVPATLPPTPVDNLPNKLVVPPGEYGYGPITTPQWKCERGSIELTNTGSWVLRMDDE